MESAQESPKSVLNRVRKQLYRSFPLEPERVRDGLKGISLALKNGCEVNTWDAVIFPGEGARSCISVQWPTIARPPIEFAKALRGWGFKRVTNHKWAFPVLNPADES